MATQYMINTIEVVLKAERSGEERRNVIHYRYYNTPPTIGELQQLCAAIEGSIIQEQEDFTALGTHWYEVQATNMDPQHHEQYALNINRVSAGPIDNMPGAVSHCLSKRTGQRGGSYRGRFYLFDLPEDYFNGDDLNIFYIPSINELVVKLLAPLVNGRFVPAVGSRKLGGSTPFLSMTYDLVADTQVRRGKNRGI